MGSSNILELIFKTSKQGQGGKAAAAELKEVKGVVGDLSTNFLGFNAASLTAAGAVAAVAGFVTDATTKFVDYGEKIRGLTALTGTGAEETSRLMQAFDDMGISAEKFGAIVESSAKKGFVFTLENVKALADEYKALPGQVEKNALLQERLGKGASAAAKAFEEGSEAIEGYYKAVSDGMALTDEEVRQADLMRRNIDNLKDSWDGLTLTVGGTAAGAMNEMISRSEKLAIIEEETGKQVFYMDSAMQDAAIKAWDLAESEKWVAENADKAKQMLGGYGDTAADLPGDLDAATAAQENLNNSLKAYNTQLLYNVATEGMDAEAKLQIAYGLGLVDEKSRYAIVKTQEWKELLEKGKISIDEYNRLVWDLAHGLSGIQSKDVEVRIHYYETHGGTAGETGGRASGPVGDYANGTDGWVTVPPGYPNDSYPVRLSSGESYQVVNDRQRWTGQGGQGGGATVNFTGPVNISGEMDYQKFVNRLKADLRRGG